MSGPPEPPPYQAFASAILSTCGGNALFDELSARFPTISRGDVFLGIAMAWAVRDADLILAVGEIRGLQRQLEQRRAA
jgi:hypothetical protein